MLFSKEAVRRRAGICLCPLLHWPFFYYFKFSSFVPVNLRYYPASLPYSRTHYFLTSKTPYSKCPYSKMLSGVTYLLQDSILSYSKLLSSVLPYSKTRYSKTASVLLAVNITFLYTLGLSVKRRKMKCNHLYWHSIFFVDLNYSLRSVIAHYFL